MRILLIALIILIASCTRKAVPIKALEVPKEWERTSYLITDSKRPKILLAVFEFDGVTYSVDYVHGKIDTIP